MVVAVIIGLLASIAIPGFTASRNSSAATTAASDIKSFADEFSLYNLREGVWPEDGLPSTIPTGMEQLQNGLWPNSSAIGGQWDWDYNAHGITAGVSIVGHNTTEDTLSKIDKLIDDGDLNSGSFQRMAAGHVCYILEP